MGNTTVGQSGDKDRFERVFRVFSVSLNPNPDVFCAPLRPGSDWRNLRQDDDMLSCAEVRVRNKERVRRNIEFKMERFFFFFV